MVMAFNRNLVPTQTIADRVNGASAAGLTLKRACDLQDDEPSRHELWQDLRKHDYRVRGVERRCARVSLLAFFGGFYLESRDAPDDL
jgi:hypothetical protein